MTQTSTVRELWVGASRWGLKAKRGPEYLLDFSSVQTLWKSPSRYTMFSDFVRSPKSRFELIGCYGSGHREVVAPLNPPPVGGPIYAFSLGSKVLSWWLITDKGCCVRVWTQWKEASLLGGHPVSEMQRWYRQTAHEQSRTNNHSFADIFCQSDSEKCWEHDSQILQCAAKH